MAKLITVLALVGGLAACGQPMDQGSTGESAPASMAAAPPMEMEERAQGGEPAATDGRGLDQAAGPAQPSGPAPVLYLAYSYALALELPSDRLAGVMDAHVQACQTAGPRLCQLVATARFGDPESSMQGNVTLRGEPAWLRTFMGGVEAQADAADGRLISQSTNTEDLTRQIVDTEARQRALLALRERLEALLRSRPGRLADLLEAERELARVQGELDALQSSLAVMRTRVAMSELTLQYNSAPRSVGSDTFEPLSDAFANFLRIVVVGFAAIITVIAALLPFVLVIWPAVWGLLRWRRARGGRFFGGKGKPPAADG